MVQTGNNAINATIKTDSVMNIRQLVGLFLIIATLFSSHFTYAGDRLREEGKEQKFKPRGFNLLPFCGVRWAVVDDGQEVHVYYQKTNGYDVQFQNGKEGLEIKVIYKDATGLMVIPEAALGKRPRISVESAEASFMDDLAKRFPSEKPDK